MLNSLILLIRISSFATNAYSIINEKEKAVFACVPGLNGVDNLSKKSMVLLLSKSTNGFIFEAHIFALVLSHVKSSEYSFINHAQPYVLSKPFAKSCLKNSSSLLRFSLLRFFSSLFKIMSRSDSSGKSFNILTIAQ